MSCSASSRLPSPTISRYADGQASQHERPRLEQRRVALLQLQPADHADDRRRRLHAVLVAQRAARLLVVVADEVDAVVDERPRRRGPALGDDLAVDRVRDHDQVIDRGRQPLELLLVLARADARRVDGRDHPRAPVAGLADRDHRLGAHDLRAVHVVVDDVGADVDQVGGEDPGRDGVVGLVDHAHRDPEPLELAHGAARRQRDHRDLVSLAVHARDQVVDVLLRAAVGAGREDLDDADALRAPRGGPPDRGEAGVVAAAGRHRLSVRRTSTRWIGSSTAPHSYL